MFNMAKKIRLFLDEANLGATSYKNSGAKFVGCIVLATIVLSSSYLAAGNAKKSLQQYRNGKALSTNLLKDKNPQFFKAKTNLYMMDGYSYAADSHTKDGSGSAKLEGQGKAVYNKPITTSTFHLEKGKRYTLSVYMKMVGAPRGQNLFFKVTPKGNSGDFCEILWNIAELNEWEEAIIHFRPTASGDYVLSLFILENGYSTDGKLIKPDLSNMAESPIIYYDDFSVVESDHVVSREPYTEKIPFNSSIIKIDKLGNWSVKEQEKWKNIFPKFLYQSWLPDFAKQAKRSKAYGFTGYVNITDMERLKIALAAGLKYNGIQINDLTVADKNLIKDYLQLVKQGKLSPTAILMYTYDNEMQYITHYDQQKTIAKWIDENDQDITGKNRIRPIFVLNGVGEGLARNQKSSHSNLMDVTGSYVGKHGEVIDLRFKPVDTLRLLDTIHQQKAPVSVIQMQAYMHKTFIPMLFKGIIGGGRALKFWRGGTTHSGSKMDFRENYWAPAIKGPNGVFAKIDKMLPVIREPRATDWDTTISQLQKDTIAIGKRTHAGKHYLIMANFADKDQQVKITLAGIKASKVKDYFTKKQLTSVKSDSFTIKIGHFNNGYKVLVLE